MGLYARRGKRALDLALGSVALLLALPVIALAALAIKLDSEGPVFHRAVRVGRGGRKFTFLKLRTMRVGAEELRGLLLHLNEAQGPAFKLHDDPRVSRVGRILRKLSVDELPQLLNVLRGEMSIVGPRPERATYVTHFEQAVYRYGDRHRVKSGITGWAQVNGLRGRTSLADRVEWDNFYVEHWSPWLDVKIVLLTLWCVARGQRAQLP